MIAALPDASTWETECFISAAVVGVTVIGAVSASLARRAAAPTVARRWLPTVATVLVFVAVLALVFASIDPCAQGPA